MCLVLHLSYYEVFQHPYLSCPKSLFGRSRTQGQCLHLTNTELLFYRCLWVPNDLCIFGRLGFHSLFLHTMECRLPAATSTCKISLFPPVKVEQGGVTGTS